MPPSGLNAALRAKFLVPFDPLAYTTGRDMSPSGLNEVNGLNKTKGVDKANGLHSANGAE